MFKKSLMLLLVLLLSPLSASAGVIFKTPTSLGLTSGLVGHWTMDGADTYWSSATAGTVTDKSGNNNTGTIANMSRSVSPVIGKLGQAMNFDGVDDYVGKENTISGLPTGAPITVSAWVKPNSVLSSFSIIEHGERSSPQTGWRFSISNNDLLFTGWMIQDFVSTNTNITIVADQWQFVVAVFDSSFDVTFYHYLPSTGVLTTQTITGTASFSTPSVASDVVIGAVHTSGSETLSNLTTFSDGSIDDVRIYNRALSANEISRLYNMSASNKVNTPTTSLTSGLVGYWTMDGNKISGTSVLDSSVSNKTGIITGATKTIGKLGQGLNFDGNTDYVSISNATTLTSPYSVSMWFYPRQLGLAQGLIAFTTAGFRFTFLDSTRIQIASASAGSFRTWCNRTFTASDLNKWWHLTYVVNSTTDASLWKCYLNSVSVGVVDSDSSGTFGQPTTNWTLGAYYNNSYWFDGKLDDVRVYNRAVSDLEVKQLYNMGEATKINKTPTNSQTSGLVGHWTFDGADTYWSSATAGTVTDKSGNNNTGTITNMSRSSSPTIGKIGQAMNFDGVDDKVSVNAFNLSTTNAVSLSFWMYKDNFTTPEGATFELSANTNLVNDGFLVDANSNSAPCVGSFQINTRGNTNNNTACYTRPSVRAWHHYVAIFDKGKSSNESDLYIDGALQTATSRPNNANNTNNFGSEPFYIMSRGGTGLFDTGKIDDVRIYSRVLSAEEIQQLYNTGR